MNRFDGWSGDGTAHVQAWLNIGETKGWTGGEEVKDSDMVRERRRSIARETSELEYSWDIEWDGKTEVVVIGNIVE